MQQGQQPHSQQSIQQQHQEQQPGSQGTSGHYVGGNGGVPPEPSTVAVPASAPAPGTTYNSSLPPSQLFYQFQEQQQQARLQQQSQQYQQQQIHQQRLQQQQQQQQQQPHQQRPQGMQHQISSQQAAQFFQQALQQRHQQQQAAQAQAQLQLQSRPQLGSLGPAQLQQSLPEQQPQQQSLLPQRYSPTARSQQSGAYTQQSQVLLEQQRIAQTGGASTLAGAPAQMSHSANNIANINFDHATIESILQINQHLLRVLLEYHNHIGGNQIEYGLYHTRLHNNLTYLATIADWVIKAQNIGRGLPPPPVPDLSQVSYPAVLKQSGMSGGTPLIKPSALPANNHPTAPLPQYHAAQPNGIADPAYVPAALAQMHARNQAGGSFQSVHGNSLHQNQIQNAQTFGTGGQPLSQGAHQVYGAARPTPAVHSNSQQSQQSQQAQATQQAYANVQRGLPPGFQQSQAAFQSLQPPTYPNAPPAAWMQQAMQQQQLQQQQQQQSQSQTQPQMPIQLQSQQQHQQPQPQYANVQPNYASAQRAPSAPTVHPPLQQSVNGWSPAADHRQMQRPGSGSTPADPRPPSPTSLTPTQNEQQQHQQQQHHHQHQQRSQPDEAESARSAASAPGDAHSGKADSGDDSGGGSDPGNS